MKARGLTCAVGAMLVVLASCSSPEPRVFRDELRRVPGVVGEDVGDARDALISEGFLVMVLPEGATPPPAYVEQPPGTCARGTVVTQDPPQGEDVVKATTITLYARGC